MDENTLTEQDPLILEMLKLLKALDDKAEQNEKELQQYRLREILGDPNSRK
jgi:hypothetical protein